MMDRLNLKRLTAWLLIPALLLLPLASAAAASSGSGGRSGSAGRSGRSRDEDSRRGSKVSADLLERVRKAGGSEKITAIVQPRGEWGDAQEGAFVAHGARVKRRHEHLSPRVVEMPAAAVEALAARVMDTTTSANNRIFVGIAVLDSGIDQWHKATYKPDGSASRVTGNYVFTDEPATGKLDAYGHGTHVAAAAAGSALVAGGAYKGAAYDAQIINVRVLDAQGRGSVSKLLEAMDWVIANRIIYNIRVVNLSLAIPAINSYH